MADDSAPTLQLRRAEPDDGTSMDTSALTPVNVGSLLSVIHPDLPRDYLLLLNTMDDGCLSQDLVLDACFVLSGNQDGLLSTTCDQRDAVPRDQTLLSPGQYYYFLTASSLPNPFRWPILASLAEWTVPMQEFPVAGPSTTSRLSHWNVLPAPAVTAGHAIAATSAMSLLVKQRDDQRCVLTGCPVGIVNENAHIVPKTRKEWFKDQGLHLRNANPAAENSVNHPSNGMTLRKDYHALFAAFIWLPFPKLGKFVAHFMDNTTAPLYAHGHHNSPLRLHETVNQAALFAHFAMIIFDLSLAKATPEPRTTNDHASSAGESVRRGSPRKRKHQSEGSSESGESNSSEGRMEDESHASQDAQKADEQDAYWRDVWQSDQPVLAALKETEWSNRPDWHYISFHPEFAKMKRLRRQYMRDHPEVRTISEPSKLASSRSWRDTALDEPYD